MFRRFLRNLQRLTADGVPAVISLTDSSHSSTAR